MFFFFFAAIVSQVREFSMYNLSILPLVDALEFTTFLLIVFVAVGCGSGKEMNTVFRETHEMVSCCLITVFSRGPVMALPLMVFYSAEFSHLFWDEVCQNEDDLLYMLDEHTPVKDCADLGHQVSDVGGTIFLCDA
ncbi:hypothetical protein BHE74_00017502 [Ensete ventricosum]|nr:hypothetical protein BHE74_00017502 [Ensete ventricosum]